MSFKSFIDGFNDIMRELCYIGTTPKKDYPVNPIPEVDEETIWRNQHKFSDDRVSIYIYYSSLETQYNYEYVFKDSVKIERNGSTRDISFYTRDMKHVTHSLGANDMFTINEY